MQKRGLDLGAQAGYGVGQIAGQVFRDVPSLLLLFFMTSVLGIEAAVAGAAIFVPKLFWGVLCDVSVGVLSDRWKARMQRRWWLVIGAIGAPVAMLLLFHVPEGSTSLRLAYVAGAFSLYMAVFASFSVPYLAIAGELSSDPQQRTVLMAWRLVFTAVGVLVSGALAPILVQANGGGQPGYEAMARVLAIICPLALALSFFGIGRAMRQSNFVADTAPRVRLSFRQAIKVLAAPRFSVLLGINTLQLAGQGMAYAAMLYFLSYNMGRVDALKQVGVIVLTMCGGIILSQPGWVKLAAQLGKRPVYCMAVLLYLSMYVIWGFVPQAPLWVIYSLAFFAAVGNSGWAMLGFSMLSDISGEDEKNAGLYSAAWVAADKIGFALGGTLLLGFVLSGFGFDSVRAVAGLQQSSSALSGVVIAFALLPAAMNLLAVAIFAKWGRN